MGTEIRPLAGAIVALALLVAASVLAYRNTGELIATEAWVAHTHDVLSTVDDALSLVKDAEIAVRGYLVNADDELVRRRELARHDLVERLRHLHALVADNPEQRRNVEAFDAGARAKLAYADDVLRRREAAPFAPAELADRLTEGLRRTDEVVGLAAIVQRTERDLLAAREAAAAAGTRRTRVTVVGTTALGVALLAAMLLVLQREIRDRRRVEAELRTTERRLTLALDASQMGLWDLDLATDVSYRTLRHDQIFGYDALLPSWGREAFLPHLHPDDREVERTAFERAFATDDFRMECRIIRHGDGAIRWIACQGKLVRDAHGTPLRLMGSVMDVTDRKEAEERLRERTDQLEMANEALKSFTYSVSHDLRAPLRAINGYAHILAEEHGGALNDESRRVLDVIRRNAKQMGRLIDDLLSFSRVGRTDLTASRTDLEAVARAVVDDLRRLEPDRAVSVVIGALPPAVVDAAMLRQVLANLIGNAWKFTRGRQAATIEVGSTPAGDATVYWVRDNGAGFDMQYAGRLFHVFERLHRADEFEGTGVGLAIVHRVVQRHGGRVWAEAAVGAGATFFFTLPARKGARHGAHEHPAGGGHAGGPGAGGSSPREA